MLMIATGALFTAIGLVIGSGGAWLIAIGGSWYYLLAGAGFLLTGLLLLTRRRLALWSYAAVVAATLAWALWEVGFDWWQLAPRGAVVVLLGLWLLIPGVMRGMRPSGSSPDTAVPPLWRGAGLPLTISLMLCVSTAVVSQFRDPFDRPASSPTPKARTSEASVDAPVPADDWHAYGRTGAGLRYSPLNQITVRNVDKLQVAWTYHTGDIRAPGDPTETTYEVTPIKIGDTLYLCTPHNLVIALDPATGEERWRFDPKVRKLSGLQHRTCRGISYHRSPDALADVQCAKRLFLPTADARLIALDADSGDVCRAFGGGDGTVDLWRNMPHVQEGFYYSTSPPAVTSGLVIVGGAVNDNVSTTEPSGVIRAYDVYTGELVWNWDSGNPDATEPISDGQTYTPNSPNSWSVSSVDEELGMVYVPMGNQSPDQWGGDRDATVERFSSAVVALDLQTGAVRWVFQTVRHDLWDMDVPAQPSLLDLTIGGDTVPALVQPTKQGDIFVLDRRNGAPVLPVFERKAPQGAAEGDYTAPSQPASALSFEPEPLEGKDMWGVTMFDQLACRIQFHSYRYEGRYTPPSLQGTIVYPGNFGVFNWGAVAVDPVHQTLFATPSYLAFVVRLIPRDGQEIKDMSSGESGLNENHGAPFAVKMLPFVSPIGLPCQAPPWGYVAGADLTTGQITWMHRNGTVEDLAPVPLPFEVGVPDLGGPIITAGGVAFMSGSLDYYVRAYDMATGERLWEERLPVGGQATPMTYRAKNGKQYIVVVAGGHGSLGTAEGDSIIAYALP
ncbi:glucose/quinate/shikimate family membrane-bound PQQ-dependent dehydrogenase [Thalassobaculum sp.]|uniref:glucose/quinate/shikimate family membrane-bound PQQ-dependent dehydrogenase n=1 Tax=Thalassobaculum sp. TaxID=2022740 RepID=UPI0032EE5AB4